MESLRRKLYYWLIRIANRIKPGDFYDFGEEIKACMVYRDRLYVGTVASMYRKNKSNDKWKKVS